MSNLIYTELINSMTWSYSRVASFNDCKYGWFLKYIRHEEQCPKFYSSYGTFMHKLIERYYRKELTKPQMKTEFLLNFQTEVKGDRPPGNIVSNYIHSGLAYIDSFTDFPYKMVSVEEKIEFEIDGIPFVGIIDYLGESDGEYHIIDNKSRALKPRSGRLVPTKKDEELDRMLVQLYIYAAAVKYKYGKFPKTLCFNCFRTGVFIEEPFVLEKYYDAINWVKDNIETIKQASDFSPWLDFFACTYICGYSNECCYWQERGRI